MKYLNYAITFREFPDEISLCINITECPHRCKGCHSPELWEDVGEELTTDILNKLINVNKGITLVGFMGGDSNPVIINYLAAYVVLNHPGLKVGWYSGNKEISEEIDTDWFDYIKLGPYIAEKGPLNNPNTNQKMYHYTGTEVKDITYKFWNYDGNNN